MPIETITKEELITLAVIAGGVGLGVLLLSSGGAAAASGGFSHVPGMSAPYLSGGPTGVTSLPAATGASGLLVKLTPIVDYLGPPRNVYTYAKIIQNNTVVAGSGVAGVSIGFDNPTAMKTYPLVPGQEPQPDGTQGPYLWVYTWPGPPGPGGGTTVPGGICGTPPVKGAAQLILDVYYNSSESGNSADADGFSSPTCNHRTLQAQSQAYPIIFS